MINVKQFDGLDLPEWMDESQANLICSFLNSLHKGGSQGVRFHVLSHFKGGLFLHLINRDRLPEDPHVAALYDLITRLEPKL